jgi:hypothetical protein
VSNSDRQLDFRHGYLPAPPGVPSDPTITTTALLAVLLAYAIGFVILYPIAEASVAKSMTEGNDPLTQMEFVGP